MVPDDPNDSKLRQGPQHPQFDQNVTPPWLSPEGGPRLLEPYYGPPGRYKGPAPIPGGSPGTGLVHLEQQRMRDKEIERQREMDTIPLLAQRQGAGGAAGVGGATGGGAAGGQVPLVVTGDDEAAQKIEQAIEKGAEKGAEIAAKVITTSVVEAFKTGVGNSKIGVEANMGVLHIVSSSNGGLNANIDTAQIEQIVSNAINENINSADGSMRDPMTSRSMTSPANNSSMMS